MDNMKLREKIGQAAHQDMQKYAPDIVWNIWESLITEVESQRWR